MTALGQILLLLAFVASGWAAFAGMAARSEEARRLWRHGVFAAITAAVTLTIVCGILSWALVTSDFSFRYVAENSNKALPWHYALSAFWVGQAGSLLIWAWMLAVLSLVCLSRPAWRTSPLCRPAFGVLMACLCFLAAVMIFAADPMEPSLSVPQDGDGLSPLLQHPAMLIHPPIVFLGYAGWAVPFALAIAALLTGRLDGEWIIPSRPWALFAWLVLGCGILLGADWAYEELGWGGYWSWDPIENGSLIPWLTGTALIHVFMVWQFRQSLKKTALALAIVTFGLCNFATFLTRSGIFSSLHAFSHSPVGWIFLGGMVLISVAGVVLIARRREQLSNALQWNSIWTREAVIAISTAALLLLAGAALLGTCWVPLSDLVLGHKVMLGPAFYNKVLVATGLPILLATALAPLLRWGKPPSRQQKLAIAAAALVAMAAVVMSLLAGLRHVIALAVVATSALTVTAFFAAVLLDANAQGWRGRLLAVPATVRKRRRQYAGFVIHLAVACLALGITGTSLGTQKQEITLQEGETITWAGRSISHVGLEHRRTADKHIVEAQLEITPQDGASYTLQPARHLHHPQDQWTTEVAIHNTWRGDFYTILHYGEDSGAARLTLIDNPLARLLWLSGWIATVGVVMRLWPARGRRPLPRQKPTSMLERHVPEPHCRRARAAREGVR